MRLQNKEVELIYIGGKQVKRITMFGSIVYEYNEPAGHTLEVIGPFNVSGETCQLGLLFDNEAVDTSLATWSISAGSEYATVDSSGLVTIIQSANENGVTISCSYRDVVAQHIMQVTYVSGASTETTTETTVDPETGDVTTVVETVVTNDDGSSTSNSVTTITDENGDPVGSNETNTTQNSDGSSSSTSTNYDANGDPTDQTNQETDTSGNNSTQNVVFDENGDPEVTGYDIDTSENPSGTMEIDGNGVNTEFVPFDGSNKGWICHIKFRSIKTEQPNPPTVEDTEDHGSNYLFNILNMMSPDKPYPGIYIRWALSKKNYSSGKLVFGYTSGGSNATRTLQINPTTEGLVELNIIYDPDMLIYPSKFRMEQLHNNAATLSVNVEFNSNQMDFTIGYAISQQGEPYRYANLELYDFSISKLAGY